MKWITGIVQHEEENGRGHDGDDDLQAHTLGLKEGHEEGYPAPVVVVGLSLHPGEVAFLHVRQEDVGEELGEPGGVNREGESLESFVKGAPEYC